MNPEEKIQELELDIDKLRALLAKMTPGPWAVRAGQKSDELFLQDGDRGGRIARLWNGRRRRNDDAEGIAALRNAAPALLDELEQARQRIAELADHLAIVYMAACPGWAWDGRPETVAANAARFRERLEAKVAELERENAELRARIDQLKSWSRADAAKRASRWVP